MLHLAGKASTRRHPVNSALDAMKTSLPLLRVSLIWIVTNIVVAGIFLLVASNTWVEPELADVPGASGGAGVVWFVTAVPVAAVATLLNFAALVWALVVRIKHGIWPANSAAWLGLLVWLAAIVFDNSRHGA